MGKFMLKINKYRALLCAGLTAGLLAGCAKTPKPDDTLHAQIGYTNPSTGVLANNSAVINPIRMQALRETSTTLGANGALAWQSAHINRSLEQQVRSFDSIFDFNQLLLAHNVLPPVLTEADNSLNLSDDDSIRLSSKTYRIVSQARFVTAPPTWRTYLWMDFKKPDLPDRTLLPQTPAETMVWDHYLKEGWQQGVAQANAIFAANLSRLKRDYKGMILYRKLLAEKMVSAPYVAQAELGVTGNAHEIRIDDRVLRITAHSELQPDSAKWNAVLTNEK
jgi:defect-in-organelle-trafficking protein DotC